MKLKLNIRRELKIGGIILLLIGLIAFTERNFGNHLNGTIEIKIVNLQENHFISEEDVRRIMELNPAKLHDGVDFKLVEQKLRKNPFISDAELYTDLKGTLFVKVQLRRPIARMVRNDGPDGYLADDGTVMPVSDEFTARVVLISGPYVNEMLKLSNISNNEMGIALMSLLKILSEDEFWHAQVAQLDIDAKGRIQFFTQIGDERIEFGTADNLEDKLSRLMIYYKEILPRTGWNKYARVNLEYEGQIVTE